MRRLWRQYLVGRGKKCQTPTLSVWPRKRPAPLRADLSRPYEGPKMALWSAILGPCCEAVAIRIAANREPRFKTSKHVTAQKAQMQWLPACLTPFFPAGDDAATPIPSRQQTPVGLSCTFGPSQGSRTPSQPSFCLRIVWLSPNSRYDPYSLDSGIRNCWVSFRPTFLSVRNSRVVVLYDLHKTG